MPQYQPIDYARGSGQVDPLQVARQYQGLQSDKLINQQNQLKLQQQQQAPARLDAFKMGLQQLDRTDPKAVANFNVQFPEFAEQTQAIVTGQQEQTQKAYDFKSQQEKDLVKRRFRQAVTGGNAGKTRAIRSSHRPTGGRDRQYRRSFHDTGSYEAASQRKPRAVYSGYGRCL